MTDHLPSKERDNGLCYEHEYPKGGMSTTVWKKSSCPFCQIEAARRTAEHWKAEHLAGNAEIERLRTTLRGISTCSTCEACRGAALRALGEEA